MRKLWIALTLIVAALSPAATLAHGGPEVGVQGDVRAGGGINISGEEFPDGELVDIAVLKDGGDPVKLGTVTAGGDETFEAVFHVPEDLRPGLYQLVAVSGDESASAEVTVLKSTDGAASPSAITVSNDRSTGEAVTLAAIIAGVAAFGVFLLWISRTRPRRAHV